jgi:adenylate kinase
MSAIVQVCEKIALQGPNGNRPALSAKRPVAIAGRPGRILLLGAPGVGKGTQAKELAKMWRLPHISTGDLLRSHVSRQTPMGRAAKEIMARGELVPDSLVQAIVEDRLHDSDAADGCILDGFPRTLEQAIWLDGILATQGQEVPIVALVIRIDRKQLTRRIIGRRSCPACQTIYNIYMNPPARDGFCDREGAELVQRTDDTEEIFAERMRTYERQTARVINYYRTLGRVADVDGDRPIGVITEDIAAAISRLRRARS